MNTQWRKIAGDLRQHGGQIALIALVIAVGTAGVVGALNARAILEREIDASFGSAHVPDVALSVDRVEPAMLELVRTHEDVAEADARRTWTSRVAGTNEEWIGARLVVVADLADQRVGRVHLHEGDWRGADRGLYVEQSSWEMLGLKLGEPLRIRTPGGGTATIPVVGLVHDAAVAPGFQERIVYLYLSPAAARQLGQDGTTNQIVVRMKNRASGPARLLGDLAEMFADAGHAVRRSDVLQAVHPHFVLMATMLRVLGILAAMAFVCSAALAAYVVALWMKREVRQIGIMKTIGATSGQLAAQYLALVVPVVFVIAVVSVPVGGWLGDALVGYNQRELNIDVASWSAPRRLLLAEIALAVAIPLVAMAFPVVRAARATAREAIQDPGITAQTASRGTLSRFVFVPGSRQWTFALRNLFRRPWRLTITLVALTAGGGLMLAANFHFASLMQVVDRSLNAQAHDIQVQFRRPIEIARLEALLREVPNVARAEAWQRANVRFGTTTAADGTPSVLRTLMTAYPHDSRLRTLPLVSGRWPDPDEADAVVINRSAREAVGVELGGVLTLEADNRPAQRVRVVGTFEEFQGAGLYANQRTFDAVAGARSTTGFLLVQAAPGRTNQLATDLDLAFIAANADAAAIDRRVDRRQVMEEHFLGVIGVANLVAIAAAALGGICLAAFASLNVLERVREIGVIRTLGATPSRVTVLFLAESGAIALVSAALALALGVGVATLLNWLVETKAFKISMPLVVEGRAVALLAAGGVLVVAGVWLPVSRLVRVSVREALGYE
jgi:putative ABC transport system permease protein